MSTSISITRALVELKTLQKRITRLLTSTTFVSTKVLDRAFTDHVPETKSNFSALKDLIARFEKIKFAIVMSNAQTKVNIGKHTYTVAEAIAKKECLRHSRDLLETLREQKQRVDMDMVSYSTHVEQLFERNCETMLKKENGKNPSEYEMKSYKDIFFANHKMERVDPLNIDMVISKLTEEIEDFDKTVDFVLSESNAVTLISV